MQKNIMMELIDNNLDVTQEEKEIWKVTDDSKADWTLDKIREIKAEYKRFELVANDKMQQIQMALDTEKKRMDNDISFFENKLREYFESLGNVKETKTQKSHKLPSGTLKLKKSTTGFDYNKDKLLEYAEKEKMVDFIKVKKDFDWAEFKKQLDISGNNIVNKETGEIIKIEGLKVSEKPSSFIVEV